MPLIGLETAGDDRGLGRFVRAGFFLLQSFQRPLKFSIAGIKQDELTKILRHSVDAHVAPAVRLAAPRGVIALGRPAAAVVSEIFPRSDFAQAYNEGGLDAVQGRLFRVGSPIPLGASFLLSGAGRFRRDRWSRQIPELVTAIGDE